MSHKKVKIAAVGLGNRTRKYLRYVAEHKEIAELVAVVDPDPSRTADVMDAFALDEDGCFPSMDSLIASGRQIDACIIGTPDIYHHELAVKAMRSGWNVLLEKPMGQTQEQCLDIVRTSVETGKMVSVCYVLRYHPYFMKLKEISGNPANGRILSIRHTERVGRDRTAHTFVRGPWNMKEMNTSVFFTKCCHDVDFVLWLAGHDVKSVSSTMGTRIFSPENAPAGASGRCCDCQVEKSCPYSAVDLYFRRRDWIKGFAALPGESPDDMIGRMLRESRYGRCVYDCPENDVVDCQTVFLEMESGIKAEIMMECPTDETNRVTVIDCENAVIYGDETRIEIRYKDGRRTEEHDFRWTKSLGFHARADFRIMEEFISSINSGQLQTKTSCAESLDSHLICFRAEKCSSAADARL